MMLDADRTGTERPGAEGPDASTAPIVIVQRGSSSWGREILLLLLLVSAAGYIIYQEDRVPRFLDRGEVRAAPRMVDAAKVAPVAEGEVVLRVDGPPDAESPGPADPPDGSRPEVDDPDEAEPVAADLGSRPGAETPAAAAPEVSTAPLEPGSRPPEDAIAFPPEGPPSDAVQGSREIVWDMDRREGRDDRSEIPVDADPIVDRRPVVADRAPDPPREFLPPTAEQRQHFLRCLAIAIQREGLRAGPQIDGLCRDFGVGLPVELDAVEARLGPQFLPAGWDIDRTVIALRRIGVPEPYLLDRLSEQMNRTIGARHGPRNRMEARVFAARRLLSIPLESAR